MNPTQRQSGRPNDNIAVAALLCLAFGWLAYAYHRTMFIDGGDPWMTGDWLINNTAGLVRRGIFGEAVRQLQLAGLPATWSLYAIQTGTYAAIFLIVLRLYLGVPRQKEWALLVLSPAFLLFPFYDFPGGFRKEILGFLSCALIALAATRKRPPTPLIALGATVYLVH